MGAFIDITGQIFGRLTPVEFIRGSIGNKAKWRCICVCGNECYVGSNKLTSGWTKSCGCIWLEEVCGSNKTHGLINTPEYRAWAGAKDRCYNKNALNYKDYGGRGIKMCSSWLGVNGFYNFIKDMGNRTTNKHSLDRINNNKGYSKENCRWATRTEQARNRRSNILIEKDGVILTITEWAIKLNIEVATLWARHKRGMPIDKLFCRDKICAVYYTYNGTKLKVKEWISRMNISSAVFYIEIKNRSFEDIAQKHLKEEYQNIAF